MACECEGMINDSFSLPRYTRWSSFFSTLHQKTETERVAERRCIRPLFFFFSGFVPFGAVPWAFPSLVGRLSRPSILYIYCHEWVGASRQAHPISFFF